MYFLPVGHAERPRRGYFFVTPSQVTDEPAVKRAVAFIDGQNLFFAAKDAFGYTHPNYDFPAVAKAVCAGSQWNLTETRFYTGTSPSCSAKTKTCRSFARKFA